MNSSNEAMCEVPIVIITDKEPSIVCEKVEVITISDEQGTVCEKVPIEVPITIFDEPSTSQNPMVSDTTKSSKSIGKKEKKKREKKKVTHFLAMQINDVDIIQKVKSFQDHLLEQHAHLKPGIISPSKFHTTLTVLSLPSQDDVDKAIEILRNYDQILSKENNIFMNIHSVGHFSRCRVIWAGIKDDLHSQICKNLSNGIYQRFKTELASSIVEPWKWTPHLTVYKTNFRRKNKKNNQEKQLSEESYSKFLGFHFGTQHVSSIQLLEMKGSKDGYYVCPAALGLKDGICTFQCTTPVVKEKEVKLEKKEKKRGKKRKFAELDYVVPNFRPDMYPLLDLTLIPHIPRVESKMMRWLNRPNIQEILPTLETYALYLAFKRRCTVKLEILPPQFVIYKLQLDGFIQLEQGVVKYLNFNAANLKLLPSISKEIQEQNTVLTRCCQWLTTKHAPPSLTADLEHKFFSMCWKKFGVELKLLVDNLVQNLPHSPISNLGPYLLKLQKFIEMRAPDPISNNMVISVK